MLEGTSENTYESLFQILNWVEIFRAVTETENENLDFAVESAKLS